MKRAVIIFITGIIIECFALDISHHGNQLHFKKYMCSQSLQLESFSIPVNFTTDDFSTSYKL